jgi:hypothetical protein
VCAAQRLPIKLSSAPDKRTMLLTIFFIVMILWLAGIVTAYTLGGLIHLLLLLGVIILFIEYLERRKVL